MHMQTIDNPIVNCQSELWMMYDICMYIQHREWDLTIHMTIGV